MRPVALLFAMASSPALVALTPTASAQTAANPLVGTWRANDGKAIITIAPCGNALCGRIIGLRPGRENVLDVNNPTPALRARRVMGINILSNLVRDGNAWKGRGYSPEEGRNFNATVTPNGNRMTVRGCVAIFCRTVDWTRAR